MTQFIKKPVPVCHSFQTFAPYFSSYEQQNIQLDHFCFTLFNLGQLIYFDEV